MTIRTALIRDRRGQATVEFALVALVFLALLLAVIDLARAAYLKNRLDNGAADLARNLAAISGTTTSGSQYVWTPPPLDPASSVSTLYQGNQMSVQQAIQAALEHASGIAGNTFSVAPLAPAGGTFVTAGANATMAISNPQVVVEAFPNLSVPQVITVTVTAPFNPIIGRLLPRTTFNIESREEAIPVEGLTPG